MEGSHPTTIRPQVVEFEATKRAKVVKQRAGADAPALLAALAPELGARNSLLLVCGGVDDLHGWPLEVAGALLGSAVISAATASRCIVLDSGTAAGVALLMGAARAEAPGALPVLIGVAPAGKVAYPGSASADGTPLEPNHTHFVLADSADWGGETELMFAVAEALTGGERAAVVLAGGGSLAKAEVLEAVKRGWPVFVIEGTGGTAQEVAAAWRTCREPRPRAGGWILPRRFKYRRPPALSSLSDAQVREIVSAGDIRCFVTGEPAELARQIAWEIQNEPVLKDAWRTFAAYDALAIRVHHAFGRFQKSILALGILATLVALLANATGAAALHWVAIAAPILLSSAIALANRRAARQRWLLLRAAAETVKGEIYRYRARVGAYADARLPEEDPAARPRVLADQLGRLELALAQTDVGSGLLDPYTGPLPPEMHGASRDDDGLSPLDSTRYLRIRLGDQLAYFNSRVTELERRRGLFQAAAVIAGGSGAILAAAGVEVWIGLTTAISGAALAYLWYLQVDDTIVAYNRVAAKLHALERDWQTRDTKQQDLAAFEELVLRGEATLGAELGGRMQNMTEAPGWSIGSPVTASSDPQTSLERHLGVGTVEFSDVVTAELIVTSAEVRDLARAAFEARQGSIRQEFYASADGGAAAVTVDHSGVPRLHVAPFRRDGLPAEREPLLTESLGLAERASAYLDRVAAGLVIERLYRLATRLLVTEERGQGQEVGDVAGDRAPLPLELARAELDQITDYYAQTLARREQWSYCSGMFGALALIWGAILPLVITGTISSRAWPAVAGGATGAVLSVLQRIGSDREWPIAEASRRVVVLWGMARPVIGAVLGGAVYAILDAGFLTVTVAHAREALYFGVLGFLAGFAERFAKPRLASGLVSPGRTGRAGGYPELRSATNELVQVLPQVVQQSIESLVRPPTLIDFSGYVRAEVLAYGTQPHRTLDPLQRGKECVLRTTISATPSEAPTERPIEIKGGRSAREVPFALVPDSETVRFKNGPKEVVARPGGPPSSADFPFEAPTAAGAHQIWVQVRQQNRTVQVVPLQIIIEP